MKKLKTILQFNIVYYILFLTVFIYAVININLPSKSKYSIDDKDFVGVIQKIYIDGNYLNIVIDGKERLGGSYYFEDEKEKTSFINEFELGDIIYLNGVLSIPQESTNYGTFNYKEYLLKDNQHYLISIKEYRKIDENNNILLKLKNRIIDRISTMESSPYLNALILGNSKYLGKVKQVYQNLGISHLFATSGMHISLISVILIGFFKFCKINEKLSVVILNIVILIYMFLTGFNPSIQRAGIFFVLLSMNKLLSLNIKTINLLLLTGTIIILVNPYLLINVGFLFSFVISLYLILCSNIINKGKNYLSKLLLTSFVAFLSGVPISLYYFYQLNILSVIYNLFFVPLVSIIIFPLSLVSLIFPFIEDCLLFFIKIMETVAFILNKIPSVFIFKKLGIICYLVYYLIISLILFRRKFIYVLIFAVMLTIHCNYNYIIKNSYVVTLDVGQGDSILIHYNNYNVLVDTGGKISYSQESWQRRSTQSSITSNTLIPSFKALGTGKIDYLIISHGDYDHMGEAINLVNNFKVEKVIFNCGVFNDLEQEFIKVLDKKRIPYYSCIKELNIDSNKLYFLNNKDYGNENDNSSVIYTELNNYKFLFMGDAGVEVEKDLIDKYNLKDIDVLKVGHHGSKTSSSKEFIDEINPKYSIISVEKNNRYGHPNKEVLENLEKSKIYRTDMQGSIMFKINNNKLKIETCSP